jgi:hypothetical protein
MGEWEEVVADKNMSGLRKYEIGIKCDWFW